MLRENRNGFGDGADVRTARPDDTSSMTVFKDHRFPVDVHLIGGRLTLASSPGKPGLQVATPPDFNGGIAGVWSPEDLLVASTAACFAVTLAAVAERRRLPLLHLDVRGTGHVSKREDGCFGFVAVELEVMIETDPGLEDAVEAAARAVERHCQVAAALDVPVHLTVSVHAGAAPAAVGA
jgi:organic hydroperoxide reductase OsmC/OhrA